MATSIIQQSFYGPIDGHNVGVISPSDESSLKILEPYINHDAAYNSAERGQEETTICQPGTRTRVLNQIQEWVRGDGPSTLWLYGPAGAGKSTIAYTIAKQCDKQSPPSLAFSYFFSRRNTNRNDLTKFIPTFAHQLVSVIPSLDQWVKKAISSKPTIFSSRFEDQIEKLITGPLREIRDELPLMVIVIDGLDEYSDETSKISLSQLVGMMVNALVDYPFRILFASRPEPYIRTIFHDLLASVRTIMIPLSDWENTEDAYNYLSFELSKVQEKKGLPSSWLSQSDVRTLVNKTEGIFIYASTLVKYVGANNCDSRNRLQTVMTSNHGLDSLFAQVLDNAKEHEDFHFTLGVVMFLHKPLPIGALAQLLQRDTYGIRSSFEGSLSLFIVPKLDNDYIRPYHASLREFLTDQQRSAGHFCDPVANNGAILKACASLIAADSGSTTASSDHLFYAYQNWCHHTFLILSSKNHTNIDESPFLSASTELTENLLSQGFTWLRRLKSYKKLAAWHKELHKIVQYAQREPWRFKKFILVGVRLGDAIVKFMEIYHKNFASLERAYPG